MSQVEEYFREVKNIYLYMTLKPITTIKNAIMGLKIKSSIIMLFILSITFGLLNMWYINQSVLSALASTGISLKTLNIPNGMIFLYLFLIFLISTVLFSLIFFLTGGLLLRTEANLPRSFNATVSCTIPLINAIFLSIVLNYLSVLIGTVCLITGLLIMLSCIFISIREIMHINEDITLTVYVLCFTLFIFVVYLSLKALLPEVIKAFINLPLF